MSIDGRYDQWLETRESKFNLSTHKAKLPDYNPLQDENLRSFFGARRNQRILYNNGLVDREGRLIDQERAKGKVFIIEQEFKNAEKAEALRIKEEEELRRRIQMKRHEALDDTKRAERLMKQKEEQRQRKDILKSTSAARYAESHRAFVKTYGIDYAKSADTFLAHRTAMRSMSQGSSGSSRSDNDRYDGGRGQQGAPEEPAHDSGAEDELLDDGKDALDEILQSLEQRRIQDPDPEREKQREAAAAAAAEATRFEYRGLGDFAGKAQARARPTP